MTTYSINENIKKTYQKKYDKYGVDPRSLQWHQKGAAHQRFRQFWAEIDFSNKSVLDIGCGFGEFGKFLLKRYQKVSYTGVDIVPEFIDEARKLVPKGMFITGDFFAESHDEKFDVVVASGVLNSNVPNNLEWRKNSIDIMFKSAKKVLAFNMLGAHPQPETPKESNVWYADSLDILDHCLSLTRRVILRHHYHPADFTIFMYPKKNL